MGDHRVPYTHCPTEQKPRSTEGFDHVGVGCHDQDEFCDDACGAAGGSLHGQRVGSGPCWVSAPRPHTARSSGDAHKSADNWHVLKPSGLRRPGLLRIVRHTERALDLTVALRKRQVQGGSVPLYPKHPVVTNAHWHNPMQ
ncbi:hypothetical protein NDU88_006858 [Pleurodeles waltl]|uniref:Uncharacterized protein n=1 Tax=Pleurodeles waltl TaxID=8319 RepID=A0AAV7P0L9_PLEWA|nr:hypothetical protein NDU88_006858 [Pleurodeles waltl]